MCGHKALGNWPAVRSTPYSFITFLKSQRKKESSSLLKVSTVLKGRNYSMSVIYSFASWQKSRSQYL